jgi:hypothetical protein
LYVAQNYRFQVLNVARPREPRVVGTVNLNSASTDVFLDWPLAYVGNWPSPIINVSNPASPTIVGTIPDATGGIYVRDTFAYVAGSYDSVFVYSVARPNAPVRLGALDVSDGTPWSQFNRDIELVDTIAYVSGWQMKTISVADPRAPRECGPRWYPPSSLIRRLAYAPPYLYAACYDGGVCILETLSTGVAEARRDRASDMVDVRPSVVRGAARVQVTTGQVAAVVVFTAAGVRIDASCRPDRAGWTVDLSRQPAGVYVLHITADRAKHLAKVIKTGR